MTTDSISIKDLVLGGQIKCHHIGVVACNSLIDPQTLHSFKFAHCSFYTCLFIHNGNISINFEDNSEKVGADSLIIIPPWARIVSLEAEDNSSIAGLLIDRVYAKSIPSPPSDKESDSEKYPGLYPIVLHVEKAQVKDIMSIFSQIENTIIIPHVYRKEIVGSLIYIFKTILAELDITDDNSLRDYSHKENVFKIFIHLASTHFREHRQIDYYANRLCITNTYLSRIVREVSGKTVNYFLTQMLFEEACRQLATTNTPLGQIAFDLHFSDQSAFSAFFKTKSAMTPKAYRAGHMV